MTTTKEVKAEFELNIKGLCANLASDLLDVKFSPRPVIDFFEEDVRQAFDKREKALAELETVKIERRHLMTLGKAINAEPDEVETVEGCFGTYEDLPEFSCRRLPHKLCEACKALTPILGFEVTS